MLYKENQVLLSVIIPVYNVEKYLIRCVESIVVQDKNDLEIILVDDGSKDSSGKLCDKLAQMYKGLVYIIHKSNGGLSSARNAALEIATGEYVFFLDSDDCVHPDFLKYMRKRLLKHIYDIIEFECCFEKKYGIINSVCREIEKEIKSSESIKKILQNQAGNEICLKIYKRSLFNDIRFPEGRNYEDIAVCYKLLIKSYKILYVDSEYYIYNLTNENSITKSISEKNLRDMYLSVNELCEGVTDFCKINKIDLDYVEYYRRNSYIYILIKLISNKKSNLKKHLSLYLKNNNKYNLYKYRYYDLKRWVFYQLMHFIRRI